MPSRLKKLAYANVALGPLVALINLVVIGQSISQGAIGGKGFAIAGVTISGLILLLMIGVVILLIATGAFSK